MQWIHFPKPIGPVCDVFKWINHNIKYSTTKFILRQTSDISRTLVRNKIVDHSDVVGSSPVGAAPTTSSFST